jgi:hypothetical protein
MEMILFLIGSFLFIVVSFVALAGIISAVFYRLRLWYIQFKELPDDYYPD